MRIMLLKPSCVAAIAVVCGVLLGLPKLVTADVIPYSGTLDRGSDGLAAWSWGHRANAGSGTKPLTDSGPGYTQFTSGDVPFAINPDTIVEFDFEDNGTAGLDDGDRLIFAGSIVDIWDYDDPLLSGSRTTNVGTIKLTGALDVGGLASGGHDFGLGGSLDYVIDFSFTSLADRIEGGGTVSPTKLRGGFESGDKITGTAYYQAGQFSTQFNGVTSNLAGNGLKFAIWGDNRSSEGATPLGTYTPTGGGSPEGDYAFGLDIVVEAGFAAGSMGGVVVPEPSSIVLFGLGTLGLVFMDRRRRKQKLAA